MSGLGSATFAEILHAAKSGDEQAWQALFNELRPTILGLATHDGHPDPEDVVAEVLVGMVRRLERFTGLRANLHAWVAAITRRRLADWRRRTARHPAQAQIAEVEDPEQTAALEQVEQRVDLANLLLQLDERQRDVIVMRTLAGLPAREVADRLGTSSGNIRVMTCRALVELRDAAGLL